MKFRGGKTVSCKLFFSECLNKRARYAVASRMSFLVTRRIFIHRRYRVSFLQAVVLAA
jgi:hypothetical protein